MEGKLKSTKIVPTTNILASVFGAASTSKGRCEAWTEKETGVPAIQAGNEPAPDEDLTEPFIRKSSDSESSIESERLCESEKGRIYSIDVKVGEAKDERTNKIRNYSASKNNSCASKIHGGPHRDAKVVDKFVRTNRKRRKRKDVKSVLVKLCQCCPWAVPWSLLAVSAIQICTYILNQENLYRLLIFSPVRQFEVWRFVTYTFLHAGAVHLMLNVIIQIMVAFPLETEQGHATVLLVYFGGVLAGGLGASVFEPTLMVGASAGVYCLLMSHIPHIVMANDPSVKNHFKERFWMTFVWLISTLQKLLYKNFKSLSYRYFRLVAVLVLCVSDVIYSIRHCLTKGNLAPRIGVAAHVSGAICGLLFGFIVYQGGKELFFRVARYAALLLFFGWIIATIVYNVELKF
ncbi:rhomboid-related protein 2 isoform X1 [Malaya genurostris]|uniref:rhomboid-related protein 2 isoform X1 n=1 Tax=Malaya genurostris TaxID=325434 RepID=UPI0026F3F6D2|nr:rhomboid-related protein 2 isoform X1 [Malaya genurostris]XP_058453511.1 rhomboid-related protein 2 isoform X1 [Malaya genurostris]XP_058453512.1 rhomboid-related protein 2 isoform X1 [Malaya genurostris]